MATASMIKIFLWPNITIKQYEKKITHVFEIIMIKKKSEGTAGTFFHYQAYPHYLSFEEKRLGHPYYKQSCI